MSERICTKTLAVGCFPGGTRPKRHSRAINGQMQNKKGETTVVVSPSLIARLSLLSDLERVLVDVVDLSLVLVH
jgi:hypothetical protein